MMLQRKLRRRSAQYSNKRRLNLRLFLIVITVISATLVIGYLVIFKLIVAKNVTINFTTSFERQEAINNYLGSLNNMPLLLLRELEVTRNSQAFFPEISGIALKKAFPINLDVTVNSWDSTFLVGRSSPYLLVNKYGKVFSTSESVSNQVIIPLDTQNVMVGDTLPVKNFISISELLLFLKSKNLVPISIEIGDNTLNIKLPPNTQVVIPLSKPVEEVTSTFWQVWNQYQTQGKTLKKIDLSYSYPIVEY